MSKLLKKEIMLTMHPTAVIFLALSVMLMIPNYPYFVTFFYTGLAVFFTCMNGRENNDIFYSMSLPIAKKDIVKARFGLVIFLELLQILIAVPFAVLKQSLGITGNAAGLDANIAFFGFSFVMLGLFNRVFLTVYYKNVKKVGFAFIWSNVATWTFIAVMEVCPFVVPFFRDCLDTPDNQFVGYKRVVLAIGVAVYVLLTLRAYTKAVKSFDKLDM